MGVHAKSKKVETAPAVDGTKAPADETKETATPAFTPVVKLSGVIQFWNQDAANVWDELIKHARLRATALVDERTTAVLMPDLATNGFTLLDAYVSRDLGNQWSVMAGQYKPAFGDDRYLTPAQLKRADYLKLESFVFPSFPAKVWDMGVEVKKVADQWTIQAGCVQGAGPNVTKDNDSFKDLNARVEWKDKEFAFGGSYYGGTNNSGGFTSYQNWFGLHGRFAKDGFDGRAEAVWAPGTRAAGVLQAAYRTGDWEPLVWGELGWFNGNQAYQLLGAGLNFWVAPKTRLSVNGTLNGVTDFSGPAAGILQVEEIF